jgi:hypothetical protein
MESGIGPTAALFQERNPMNKFKMDELVCLKTAVVVDTAMIGAGTWGVVVGSYQGTNFYEAIYEVEVDLSDGPVVLKVGEDLLWNQRAGASDDRGCKLCNNTGKRTFQRLMDVDGKEEVSHVGIVTCDCPAGKALVRSADDAATATGNPNG